MTTLSSNKVNVVVTGGNGMVGKCIQDMKNTYPNANFTFLNRSLQNEHSLDLTDRNAVLHYFKHHAFNYIIHLAADVGGLFKNLKQNTSIFSNNIRINENILEACIQNNIHRGIFILSSCIFPCNPSVFPMTENMVHESPPHFSNQGYAYAKRMLHIQCQQFNKDFNTQFICLVPVNLYGPYDNFRPSESHLIPGLIQRFHETKLSGSSSSSSSSNSKKQYHAYGTGKPLRQLLYTPDFAKIICDILLTKPNIQQDTIICCSDIEYSIRDIVHTLSDTMHISQDSLFWDTEKSDGCMKKTVSNTHFKTIFPNFKFTDISLGLQKTYQWYLHNQETLRK